MLRLSSDVLRNTPFATKPCISHNAVSGEHLNLSLLGGGEFSAKATPKNIYYLILNHIHPIEKIAIGVLASVLILYFCIVN